ncbi:MAG: inositol monophosphatase [Bacteroidetes bacterium]|nr:inositol monophosphatase [Bacteroidota bacterium]
MQLTKNDLNNLCNTAIEAAQKAGSFIRENTSKNHSVQNKNGADSLASQVVTEVDFKAQGIILSILEESIKHYDLALLTEESVDDKSRFEKDYFWCIDPMDGTLAFTEKTPGYSVSIGLVSKTGEPQIGVVYDPTTNLLYHAIKGQGAFKNEMPWKPELYLSGKSTFTLHIDRTFVTHKLYDRFMDEIKLIANTFGITTLKIQKQAGAVLNACWVVEEAPSCYFKLPKPQIGGGSLWDFAATNCIVSEAGGFASDFYGAPINLNRAESTFMNHKGVLFASNIELQEKIIALSSMLSE